MTAREVPAEVAVSIDGDVGRLIAATWRREVHEFPAERRLIGAPLLVRDVAADRPARRRRVSAPLADAWRHDGLVRLAFAPAQPGALLPTSAAVSERYGRPCAVHTVLGARRAGWGWPLRVAARTTYTPLAEELRASLLPWALADACDVVDAGAGPVDMLFVDHPDIPADLRGMRSGVVIVLASETSTVETLGALVHETGAIVSVPRRDVGWFGVLVRELADGAPLDVAVATAVPEAGLLASPELLALTSLQELVAAWARTSVLEGGEITVPPTLRGHSAAATCSIAEIGTALVNAMSTATETGWAAIVADASRALEAAGHRRVEMRTDVGWASAAPPTAGSEPLVDDRQQPESVSGAGARPSMGEPGTRPTGPSPRYLNVRPRILDSAGQESDDDVVAFIGGRTYRFGIAVRARRAAGARLIETLGRPVVFPAPVSDTDLTVVVFPRGRMDLMQRARLPLPADSDSDWCNLDVPVPADRDRFELVVGVFGDGPLQAGLVSGRVVATDNEADSGEPWTFSLASLGLLGVADQAPTIVVDDAADSGPADTGQPGERLAVLRLSSGAVDAVAEDLGKTTMRATLLAALESERSRPTLKRLGRTLASLAIDGRLLRDQLVGTAGPSPYYDAAERIVVVSMETGDPLPLELAYDHASPRTNTVPICPDAFAGASSCAPDCAHRDDRDVVCPFGFWGTSKIVERVRVTRPAARVSEPGGALKVSSAWLLGLSAKVSGGRDTVASRIRQALLDIAQQGTYVPTWDMWDDSVRLEPPLLVLVAHTDLVDGRPALEIGGRSRPIQDILPETINPAHAHPGPLVLLLGCETAHLRGSYTNIVDRLHCAGADVVVSLQTKVLGAHVADLLAVLAAAFHQQLAADGPRRVGAVLRDTRASLLRDGRVVGLALVTTGDAGIEVE